ncbi:MAG: cytochrome P450 [Myxococcales bacterium]|nr:cytochrome P450 [Myxococcales bacterium]
MGDPGLDPFQARTAEERHAVYARLRRESPVSRLPSGAWFVASRSGVRTVLLNVEHFVGSFGNRGDLPEEETVIAAIPEPRHGLIRKILNSGLAFHHASKLEPFVRETTARLLEDTLETARNQGEAELCASLSRPLPCAVIARAIGIPDDDVERFATWSDELLTRQTDVGASPRLGEMHHEFVDYVDEQIRVRVESDAPPQDLVTRLLETEVEGERLSRRAVRTQVLMLILAGNETTRNLIGNLLWRLACDPDLAAQLRADPAQVEVAIEESLRLDTPVQFLVRTCTRPIEVDGVKLDADDRVIIGVASANRDEQVFETPDRFRLDRPRLREHVGFGAGPHVCPGAFLARMEARIAIQDFLAAVERLALAPGYTLDTNPVPWAFGPQTLRVTLG